jgi:hypothetical protein
MKNRARNLLPVLAVLSISNLQPAIALAQGTSFTYQGQLQNNGSLAGGTYNLQFQLYTNSSGGTAVAGPVTNNGVVITNGLFTVTMDFGSSVWNGQTNWLQIGVESNGASSFTLLTPRQQLTPVPYAIYAEGANAAGLSGVIPASSLSGTYGGGVSLTNGANSFVGNGAGLVNVNASFLGGLGASNFWQTTGNSGTVPGKNFLGTVDNQPLELWVNQARALRLEPGTNSSSVVGAPNVIGGAPNNYVDPGIYGATIAGGGAVLMTGYLPGPSSNHVSAIFGSIGGGRLNNVGADHGTIGGGIANTILPFAYDCVIGGGNANTILGNNSESVISGGMGNTNGAYASTIAGGCGNLVQGNGYSSIGGGDGNSILGSSSYAVIGGGFGNVVGSNAIYGVIAGGSSNTNSAYWSVIGGGSGNTVEGIWATIGGGENNGIWGGGLATIAGGWKNTINDSDGSSENATIGGGVANTISNDDNSATISGGAGNTIQTNAYASYLGGGNNNTIQTFAQYGTLSGGAYNTVAAYGAAVSGGQDNYASGDVAVVSGGQDNFATGLGAVAPGGYLNLAYGAYSFAAGQFAEAAQNGTFVWSDDSSNTFFVSTTSNQFNVRATGGVRLLTSGAGMTLDGQSVVPSGNYVFAYSTMPQNVTPSFFQNAIFSSGPQISGWNYIIGTSQFICPQTGLYLVQYTAQAYVVDSVSMRGTVNSIEVPGSQAYASSTGFGGATTITKSFLASINSGAILTIQYTGNSSGDYLQGGGSGTTLPSISLTITRIQ